jgi:nitrite reductase/ring-hydroxylating ferredoxin subunit
MVSHIGTYRRELPVSLERLYENAIDWEHLPYLHRSTFARIERLDSDESGFRARLWTHPYDERRSFVIELRLERDCGRWITTTLEGPGTGTEIWTHAFAIGERATMVVVDFFVRGAVGRSSPTTADFYRSLYARLYDEDVWMMTERQRELDRRRARGAADSGPVTLGHVDELRRRLPMDVEFEGRPFRLVELEGSFIAYSTICPHMLGPLAAPSDSGATAECPWHGYRFDIRTRQCVSGAECRLAPAPAVFIGPDGSVTLADRRDHRP